jgi:hypothetical protein
VKIRLIRVIRVPLNLFFLFPRTTAAQLCPVSPRCEAAQENSSSVKIRLIRVIRVPLNLFFLFVFTPTAAERSALPRGGDFRSLLTVRTDTRSLDTA